jgi:uncharacterized membrane protein YgcG
MNMRREAMIWSIAITASIALGLVVVWAAITFAFGRQNFAPLYYVAAPYSQDDYSAEGVDSARLNPLDSSLEQEIILIGPAITTPVSTLEPIVAPEPTLEPIVTSEPTLDPIITPEPTLDPISTPENNGGGNGGGNNGGGNGVGNNGGNNGGGNNGGNNGGGNNSGGNGGGNGNK